MMQNMPMGDPVRTRWIEKGWCEQAGRGIRDEDSARGSKVAHGWLEWVAREKGENIRHFKNGSEVRLGERVLSVDGFGVSTSTAYQFHGCFWHGHPCVKTAGNVNHPHTGKAMEQLHRETLERDAYVSSLGYGLVVMWECQWQCKVSRSRNIKTFLAVLFHCVYHVQQPTTPSFATAVSNIRSGQFFGLVECDISAPPHLRAKFSEMAPIFKNVKVGREHLGERMLHLARQRGYLSRPSRMLVGALKDERVLLFSELTRWYLQHGLVITRIYQLLQYKRGRSFQSFGESVSAARREGDSDPAKCVIADTAKLVGNSCFGKTIVDKGRHRRVLHVDGHAAASKFVSSSNFGSLQEPDSDGLYEICLHKEKVGLRVN